MLSDIRAYIISDAGYDDKLMFNIAQSLTDLKWLGVYSQLTLAKGMIFPLYLALIKEFAIPFLMTNTFLCFATSLIFVKVLGEILNNRIVLSAIFTVLMFNPVTYAVASYQRVYRDAVYQYFVVLLFSCVIAIYLNRNNKLSKLLTWSVFAGIFFTLTWFEREDSIWVVPFVIVAIIITLLFIIFDKQAAKKVLRCCIVTLPCLILFLSYICIATLNYKYYGVFLSNDYVQGYFPEAYKALTLVKPTEWLPTVPVSKETREEIYKVSPAFREIEPYLEGHSFAQNGEMIGGAFPWAFRDAVEQAGYTDAKSQQAYYKKLSEEINDGFKKGKLGKRSGYIFTFVSPWDNRYAQPLKVAFSSGLKDICRFSFANGSYGSIDSSGRNKDILDIEGFIHDRAYLLNEPIHNGIKEKAVTRIQKLYVRFNAVLLSVGLLCYLLMTGILVWSIKSKKYLFLDTWIILTGLLLSFVIRLLLTSYTTVSSFQANDNMYLASSYWIMLIFTCSSISVCLSGLYKMIKPCLKTKTINALKKGMQVRHQ